MKNTKVTGVRLTNEIKPGPGSSKTETVQAGDGYKAGPELKIDDGLGIEAGSSF